MSAKGQASVEFLLILAFVLLVATAYTGYLFFMSAQLNGLQRQAQLNAFVRSIGDEINKAFLGGSGSVSSFFLQPQYDGRNYTLYTNSTARGLEIVLDDGRHSTAYLAGPVLQVLWRYGANQTFQNVNGTVVIR